VCCWRIATALLALSSLALAEERVSLRYRFQPDQELLYRIEHQLKVISSTPERAEEYESLSITVRAFTVEGVHEDGSATLQLSIRSLQLRARTPNGSEIQVDSSQNPQHPLMRLVGKPLVRLTASPTGAIGRWEELQESAGAAGLNVRLLRLYLPENPVAVGESWTTPIKVNLPQPLGKGEEVVFEQLARLRAVQEGLATIELSLRWPEPEKVASAVKAKLAQFLLAGSARFDLNRGLLRDMKLTLDQKVAVEGQSNVYQGLYREEFVPAVAAETQPDTRR
jgi:hypothetical protein